MHRLRGFDYKRPYFYMVTLKRLPELAAFSRIVGDAEPPKDTRGRSRYLIENEITKAFVRAIRDFAVLMAIKGHRATKQGSPEWNALVEACSRIGSGGAGVGTFMSPHEKVCDNAIAASGGKWVVLSRTLSLSSPSPLIFTYFYGRRTK
jgi:hypothetical protein